MAKCSDYANIVQDIIDNRSSRAQEIYIKRHFKICLKCLDELNLEKELKKAVQHRITNQEVPAGLADSIRKKITQS